MEKMRVAIVDDSEDAANTMVHVFELNEMEATVCRTTEQAVAFKPDAALIDLNLRNSMMTGFDFATALRQECGNKVLLIAFTGMMDVDKQKLWDAGFDNVLYKPVTVDAVLSMIRKESPMPAH